MSQQPAPSAKAGIRRLIVISLSVGVVVAGGVCFQWFNLRPQASSTELLDSARTERKSGNFGKAELLARQAFESDPQLNDAAILAAECAAAQSAWLRALEHFDRITSHSPVVRLSIRRREAEILHYHLCRLLDAERAYRSALEIDPQDISANTGLAQLLCLCGRKREAIPMILSLIRQNVPTDMLLILARNDSVVNRQELLVCAQAADPSDANPSVGLAWFALERDEHKVAESLLRSSLQQDSVNVPARVLMGRLLLAANRSSDFEAWAEALPSASTTSAELWSIRGQMAETIDDRPGAIRSYWESLRLAGESKATTFRLAHCLAEVGDQEAAEAFRDRVQQMTLLEEMQNRVLFTSGETGPELLLQLVKSYESAGRWWEAYGCCLFGRQLGLSTDELVEYSNRVASLLVNEPLKLVANSANVALKIDLSKYPIPSLHPKSQLEPREPKSAESIIAFRDDAATIGLQFQYFNGVSGPPTHRMFEFTGGGIGVFDFDLDSYPDLFLTQGCDWPPGSPDSSGGDRLFRNRIGTSFINVTPNAGIQEDGYGQGVTVGDYNSDGFPDLYVANIGRNRLWQNLGDGTFRDVTEFANLNSHEWTTSVVMVDLTGDGLPDIYDVNYLASADVFDRVCQHPDGSQRQCLPSDFRGQADRLWRNLGDGRFVDVTAELLGEIPLGMGLGVAAWDSDGSGRLSLFIANDTTPCFYFRPESTAGNGICLRERGIEAGLAFNGMGKATGSMGIAVGDVDEDTRMDLHVTNFYAEPNTLFLNSVPGFFEDRTRQAGLEGPSINMLGFGTQFLDADLDGDLELFVSNGHVDDLTRKNRPYRMPPQLFRQVSRGTFTEMERHRIGTYFEKEWLGRAATRLDWNRDGRDDLAVGHLYDATALLTNTSNGCGSRLSIRLFGIQSNRDAIGTIVQARIGLRTMTRQLTAGDGYQCSNERRLIFGSAQASRIDQLTVQWPSGLVQHFSDIELPAEILIREGSVPVFEVPVERRLVP